MPGLEVGGPRPTQARPWPLQLDVRSPGQRLRPQQAAPGWRRSAKHRVDTPAGPCSASCGQGEALVLLRVG